MTAINVIARPDRVALVTDALAYTSDGLIMNFVMKYYPIPNWPALVAARGSYAASLLFGFEMTHRFCDFDTFIARAEDEVPILHDEFLPQLGSDENAALELYFLGWSHARRSAEAYFMQTHEGARGLNEDEKPRLEIDPYKLFKIDNLVISPIIRSEEDKEKLSPLILDLNSKELAKLLEIQRRQTFLMESEARHIVGGWATVATVDESGVQMRKICEWPEDEIGEYVTPRAEPIVETAVLHLPPAHFNRQQRRAWEREQRKKRA